MAQISVIDDEIVEDFSTNLEKEARIKKEKTRLSRQFSGINKKKKAIVAGQIERAAFLWIELEDMQQDIKVNGWTEAFSQTDKVSPYMRARPIAEIYKTTAADYNKVIAQLTGLLPKEKAENSKQATTNEDVFESFVNAREDI